MQQSQNKSISVEFGGLSYRSEPDAHEEQEAHVRRAWFVVRAAHAMLSDAMRTNARGSAFDNASLTELEQLSRVWLCKETMGCVYNDELDARIDSIAVRAPDVWGRRRLPVPLSSET